MSFTRAQANSLIAKITSVPHRTGEAAVTFLQELINALLKVDTLDEATLKPEIKSQVEMERVEDCFHEYLKQNPPTEQTQPLLTVINLLFAIHTTDDINAIDHEGNTLLARALEIRNPHVLRLLIEVYRANANSAQDQHGNTLLHIKLQQRDYEAARLLVEICGATSVANDEGTTPLHLAAEQGNKDMVRLLLTRTQCDIDARDTRYGEGCGDDTPLALASLNKHLDTVKLLVGHKAQINPNVLLDRAPLSLAAEAGDSGIVRFLLEHKAQTSIQDAEYYTWQGAAKNGHGEIVEFLMDRSQTDMREGENAEADKDCLEQAADGGHIDLFARLEKRGIKADDSDIEKLLCSLVKRGDLENIKVWLQRITLAARPHTLAILLLRAAENGQLDTLKYLVEERGADTNTRTDRGDIPLHRAASCGHPNVIKYLVDEQKADINARDKNGATLLHTAARDGHPNVVTFCLERRLDINASDHHDWTPLQTAASGGNLDVVKLLVARKADINIRDDAGNTLLHKAAAGKHLDVVTFFLEQGLDINAKNQAGETPLVCAVKQIGSPKDEKLVELVRLLLEKGATTDIEGWPAILSTITDEKVRRKVAALIKDFSVNYKVAAKIHQAMSPIWQLLLPSSADIPAVLHPIMGDYIGSGLSEKATWEADFINQEASVAEQPPVTVMLVEQSLRTLAKEIDNPRLAATREERLEKIEAIRRQVIANVTEEKTKAKCIHYWKQLKKTFKALRPLDPSQDPSQTPLTLLYDKDFNACLDAAFAAIPSPSNTKPRQPISISTKPVNLGKQ
jgi:ankyrin repeat protein